MYRIGAKIRVGRETGNTGIFFSDLKKVSFRLFIYSLNIALLRRKRQTWNGYFFLINENVSSF